MSDRTKRQVLEMCVGVGIHSLVLALICMIWFRELSVFLGILIGMALAMGLLVSIAMSTELCVESASENYATKKMAMHAVIRSLAVITVIGILWKFTKINILTVALGALGMKTGAYLYPWVHKIMNHKAEQQ